MKIGALVDVVAKIPEAKVLVEVKNGERVVVTGFVIRDHTLTSPAVVFKAAMGAGSIRARKMAQINDEVALVLEMALPHKNCTVAQLLLVVEHLRYLQGKAWVC